MTSCRELSRMGLGQPTSRAMSLCHGKSIHPKINIFTEILGMSYSPNIGPFFFFCNVIVIRKMLYGYCVFTRNFGLYEDF